ncbi:MAG: DUF3303 family protein [Candidatus Sumerlaeia bacterium]|nr:DUF3303 family protein [Candidatus Sumerlaeia bacterium]
MIIERFRGGDIGPTGERFRTRGRMMPGDVHYIASWIVPDGSVCYQLMEAPNREALAGWTRHWEDLVDFEIVEVLESADFWERRRPSG